MPFEPFTLDQLTAFLTVVDTGSFSRAGRELGRVQSAISHAIRSLEQALNTELFDRSGRTPRLTPAGHRLASEARLVVLQVRQLRTTAGALAQGVEPSLTLIVDALVTSERLVPILKRFHAAFPAVTLTIHVDLLETVRNRLKRSEQGLALCIHSDVQDPSLVVRAAGAIELGAYCHARHPLARWTTLIPPSELRSHLQIVMTERARGSSSDRGVIAARTWRVSNLETKVRLLCSGIGWGNLPSELGAPLCEQGVLVPLHLEAWDGATQHVAFQIAHLADQALGPARTWLRDELSDTLRGPPPPT